MHKLSQMQKLNVLREVLSMKKKVSSYPGISNGSVTDSLRRFQSTGDNGGSCKDRGPAASSKAEDKAEDTQAAGGMTQAASEASGNVMLYSSMQEDQLMAIKEGFEKTIS